MKYCMSTTVLGILITMYTSMLADTPMQKKEINLHETIVEQKIINIEKKF